MDELWTTDVGARLTTVPALAGDRIYVGTGDGQVVVLDRDGRVTDRLETGFNGAVVGAPTVAHGSVYVFAAGGRQLVAFG